MTVKITQIPDQPGTTAVGSPVIPVVPVVPAPAAPWTP